MGRIIVRPETTKNPITKMGESCGLCYGSKVSDPERNYKRGKEVLLSDHGRVTEYVNVELILDGYSARVIREWYTHIVGATRLQASTRYINYTKTGEINHVIPPSVKKNPEALELYTQAMESLGNCCKTLETEYGIPREDVAMLFPLGMTTKVVDKRTLRSLIEMSHQRKCTRAYWEFRELFRDIEEALSEYSPEWKEVVDLMFKPKCEVYGRCPEAKSCGRFKG